MKTLSRREKTIRRYLLVILIAVELLMSFSFLGYVHVEPISLTTAYIPVLLAGALVGLPESVVLGFVFGLTSMWKASAHYVMFSDQLFSPFMSGHPLQSILLSVGSRTLFGLVIGLLYLAAKHVRYTGLWIAVISFFGRTIHSLLVYSVMGFCFPEMGFAAGTALQDYFSLNNIVSNLITAGIVMLFWQIEKSRSWREFRLRVEKAQHFQLEEHYHHLSLAVIILLMLCSAVAVAIYFVHRMNSVLSQNGIILTDANYSDLLHLQIQFLIGILSMVVLVVIFLIFNRRYATYMNYEAKADSLTGMMTRKTFFQSCRKALAEFQPQQDRHCYFIMMDLDRFKEINDRYGHPEGDLVLKETARQLQETFGQNALMGRMGGDEFALLYLAAAQTQLEADLQLFLDRIQKMKFQNSSLSCSIGAVHVQAGKTVEELYREADRLLYLAKKQGRNRYVVGALAFSEKESQL